ncbi:hypothetical protein FS749_007867 [Ceratobasidium sp. UAMH 11750]|nr:hypothetical protein FS749_007867 [Ceratobasidium sp. UAMH 11750]
MYDPQTLAAARERSRKNRKSVKYYLVKSFCDCTRCFGKHLRRPRATVETHRRDYGQHPDVQPRASLARASPPLRPASPAPIPLHDDDFLEDNVAMFPLDDNPDNAPSPTAHQPSGERFDAFSRTTRSHSRSSSSSLSWSMSMSMSGTRAPSSHSHSASGSESLRTQRRPSSPCSRSASHSRAGSPRRPLPLLHAHSHSPSDSDEEAPVLVPADPNQDAHIFGELLVRNQGVAEPPPLLRHGGARDEEMEAREDDQSGEDSEDGGNGEPGHPNGGGDAQFPPEGPEINVEPINVPGEPEGPDDDGDEIGAFDEHPTLLNVYLRTWVLYAFGNATHDTIQSILKSHQLALLAAAQIANFPADLVARIENMPLTLRALERRIDMDFSESITIYPICPVETCGKRYTFEELAALPDPQCTRHVAEPRCPGVLYTESTLADGTLKRTPTKSFPYSSVIRALGRLLSRVGIADFMQHWRRPGDEPIDDHIPPPPEPEEWFNRVGLNDRFGDITEAWLWRSQRTGLRRRYDGQVYADEATGDEYGLPYRTKTWMIMTFQ